MCMIARTRGGLLCDMTNEGLNRLTVGCNIALSDIGKCQVVKMNESLSIIAKRSEHRSALRFDASFDVLSGDLSSGVHMKLYSG